MPKKTRSEGSRADSTKSNSSRRNIKGKSTRLGRALIAGMKEAIAHARGEIALEAYTDVRMIRMKAGMSQSEFADRYRINRRTLQDWEQGRVAPDSTVRAYLQVIARNPKAVREALRA